MTATRLTVAIERWQLKAPFRITGYVFEAIELILVTLERDGKIGRGEAHGIYYRGDSAGKLASRIEAHRPAIEAGLERSELQTLMPPGGARNAVDCALWDLEAKLSGKPVWQLAGLTEPAPVETAFTCGVEDPPVMAEIARAMTSARAIKLKLTGAEVDAERVRAVRGARSDVWLGVDANQGFNRASLDRLMPALIEADVRLIEQPFPVGEEHLLDDLRAPIPIASDESIHTLADVPSAVGRFDVINVKLDKCGGLTEALAMIRKGRELGLGIMVGNMMGTSLSIAPCYALSSQCDVADLDGPIFLASDRPLAVGLENGLVSCPKALWGYP